MNENHKKVAKHYKDMQINTASSRTQIAMMHDKLFFLVREAIIGDTSKRRENLDKAQNILSQFQTSLKNNDDLTESLFLLYDYIYVKLDESDIAAWREALTVIETVKGTFNKLLNRK
jgi:flagellar biosynthetic protein FliS